MEETGSKYKVDLDKLLFTFFVNNFFQTLPYKNEFEIFRHQLSKSATSIGANYEESQAAPSADFLCG